MILKAHNILLEAISNRGRLMWGLAGRRAYEQKVCGEDFFSHQTF